MDLGRLSECSEYFRALSHSRMRETSESLICLDHVSSSIFYNLLEFSFHDTFRVPQEELGSHIQVCRLHISMSVYPLQGIICFHLQIQCCDPTQNRLTMLCFLSLCLWRSAATSWLRLSSQNVCPSWQMNSGQITVCPT